MSVTKKIVLGGGCFWCLEAVYQLVNGVEKIVSGYSAGNTLNPSYKEICEGNTGHAEVVEIHFNTEIIDLKNILEIFWNIHDPTTLNRQGNDVGTQYRSIILFETDDEKKLIQESLENASKSFKNKIVTEVQKLDIFYPAENYHQNYYKSNPGNSYCFYVVKPKIEKFLKLHPTNVKT
ncbi:MAG: peptide-methionine (S)-S-oxide reductase MsrA [Leptospiraceae bacterium]|nr:peptide-methionine (S)-S-oxide reductase MsrA [Leptospiraceae bacterium]